MAQSNALEILEICTVAPPPPPAGSELSPKSVPLTFFDICWARLLPTELLFFYEFPTQDDQNSETTFFHSILPRLKQSLSLILQHFLPLVANLTWSSTSPKPVLEYKQGDAVSFTIARSINADFHCLSSVDAFSKATASHCLVPKLLVSHERSAILAVQVILFLDCGFSMGISSHHAVTDGKSLASFLRLWAHLSKSLSFEGEDQSPISLPPELKPSYVERTLIKDPHGLEPILSKQWLDLEGPNNRSLMPLEHPIPLELIRGTFRIPQAKIEKLRRMVNNDEHQALHVSTFSLTCAYTWVCLVKAEGQNDHKNVALVFPVDCRSHLEPPLPSTYFGNYVGARISIIQRQRLLGKEGLCFAVNAISTAIKSLENGLDLTGLKNLVPTLASKGPRIVIPRLRYNIAWSSRFAVYKTDFGWGQPKKVDMPCIDKSGAICLLDTKDGDGVEIGLVLNQNHMDVFASLFAEGLESL